MYFKVTKRQNMIDFELSVAEFRYEFKNRCNLIINIFIQNVYNGRKHIYSSKIKLYQIF